MHAHTDFDAFRAALDVAVAGGDGASILATIRPASRTLAAEHGSAFRDLIAGLPVEIWHNDPQIAAAMGGSYRSTGSPRGQAALGYFRAAEGALAITPEAPIHCTASVLLGHGAALRTHGLLDRAREKLVAAQDIIATRLADVPLIRVEHGARFALESGMLELHDGRFASARAHLEYAHGLATTHLTRAEHVELLGAIALIDALSGELERAVRQVGYARELAEGTDLLETGYGAPALLAEVFVSNERYELPASIAVAPAMFQAAHRNEWEPFAYAISAQLLALQSRFVESLDIVEQSLQRYAVWERSGFGADFARALQAGLLLKLDRADEAWGILQTLEPHDAHTLCPGRITAHLRILHGDLLGAEEAIRDCEALGGAHCARTAVDVQLSRAVIESARGNVSASELSAERAFIAMARTGARSALQRIPMPALAALSRRALERPQNAEVTLMLTRIAEVAEPTVGGGPAIEVLSARERLVLAQVQRGLTVAAIAAELYISPNTVKTHLRRLYRKLGVGTREQAMRAARSLGLDREITPGSPASSVSSPEDAVL